MFESQRLPHILAVTCAFLAFACSSDPSGSNPPPPPPPPPGLSAASGNGQVGAVGSDLLDPLVAQAGDASGSPVAGITVNWEIASGEGSLSAIASTTGADGKAQVRLSLGPNAGSTIVIGTSASTPGDTVVFSAEALVPATIALVSGSGQSGRIGQPLAQQFRVEVKAGDGRGVPGATVDWAVISGDGSLSQSSTTTAAAGVANVTFTLGSSPATDTVSASATGLGGSPVTFVATGTPAVSVLVEMENIAFNAPGGGDDVTILLGDTVTWTNLDGPGVDHTASSTSVPPGGASFDSGLLGLGGTFSFVPGVRGTWVYLCQVHPTQMRDARITVQ